MEQLFLKPRSLLRTAAARTRGTLWDGIDWVLDAVLPADYANHLIDSGHSVGLKSALG